MCTSCLLQSCCLSPKAAVGTVIEHYVPGGVRGARSKGPAQPLVAAAAAAAILLPQAHICRNCRVVTVAVSASRNDGDDEIQTTIEYCTVHSDRSQVFFRGIPLNLWCAGMTTGRLQRTLAASILILQVIPLISRQPSLSYVVSMSTTQYHQYGITHSAFPINRSK